MLVPNNSVKRTPVQRLRSSKHRGRRRLLRALGVREILVCTTLRVILHKQCLFFLFGFGRGLNVGLDVRAVALRCVLLRVVLRSACVGVSAQGQVFAAARALVLFASSALSARGLRQPVCCRERVRLVGRPCRLAHL